jgi:hypothetical protein
MNPECEEPVLMMNTRYEYHEMFSTATDPETITLYICQPNLWSFETVADDCKVADEWTNQNIDRKYTAYESSSKSDQITSEWSVIRVQLMPELKDQIELVLVVGPSEDKTILVQDVLLTCPTKQPEPEKFAPFLASSKFLSKSSKSDSSDSRLGFRLALGLGIGLGVPFVLLVVIGSIVLGVVFVLRLKYQRGGRSSILDMINRADKVDKVENKDFRD